MPEETIKSNLITWGLCIWNWAGANLGHEQLSATCWRSVEDDSWKPTLVGALPKPSLATRWETLAAAVSNMYVTEGLADNARPCGSAVGFRP